MDLFLRTLSHPLCPLQDPVHIPAPHTHQGTRLSAVWARGWLPVDAATVSKQQEWVGLGASSTRQSVQEAKEWGPRVGTRAWLPPPCPEGGRSPQETRCPLGLPPPPAVVGWASAWPVALGPPDLSRRLHPVPHRVPLRDGRYPDY